MSLNKKKTIIYFLLNMSNKVAIGKHSNLFRQSVTDELKVLDDFPIRSPNCKTFYRRN
jgi:hypothetical protein